MGNSCGKHADGGSAQVNVKQGFPGGQQGYQGVQPGYHAAAMQHPQMQQQVPRISNNPNHFKYGGRPPSNMMPHPLASQQMFHQYHPNPPPPPPPMNRPLPGISQFLLRCVRLLWFLFCSFFSLFFVVSKLVEVLLL